MGRGTITGGGDNGQYSIDFDYGEATAAAKIASLQDRQARLESEIAEFDTYIADLEQAYYETLSFLDSAIATYNVSEKEDSDKDDLNIAAAKVLETDESLRITKNEQGMLKLELGNVSQEIKYLQGKTFSDSREIWCTDYTTDATGSVATIEVNGEQPLALIAPGGRPPSNSDGNMFARELQSASQVYYNAALLPGWQKFQPTYRTGQITEINRADDTCSVRLDTATSSAQGLNINQDSLLTDVPIEYMSCNAAAFEVWDDVVVQFEGQNWENPKVIGFVDNPKACGPARIFFLVEGVNKVNYGDNPDDQWERYPAGVFSGIQIDLEDPPYGYQLTDGTNDPSAGLVGLGSVEQTLYHTDAKIRFDVAWTQEKKDSVEWRDVGGYSTESHGISHTILNEGSHGEEFVISQWSSYNQVKNYTVTSVENPDPPPDDIDAVGGTYFYDSWTNVWGQPPTASKTPDREAISDYIRRTWKATPDTVQILIDGQPIEYVFYSIGLGPFQSQEYQTVVPSPESADHAAPFNVTGTETAGIIYVRKDLEGVPFDENSTDPP